MEDFAPSVNIPVFTPSTPTDTQTFLNLLAGIDRVYFRCIPELPSLSSSTPKVSPIILSPFKYSESEQLKLLVRANQSGFSAFYFPQKTKDSETCKETDIIAYRAMVLDLDGNPLEPALNFAIQPTVIIETSPDKYQCVYIFDKELVAEKELSSKQFKAVSEKLALVLGGDRAVCDAAHIFRLPGLKHWKSGKYFTSKIIKQGDKVSFSALVDVLKSSSVVTSSKDTSISAPLLKEIPLALVMAGNVTVNEGERHDVLKRICVKLAHEGKSKDEIIKIVDTVISNTFRMPVDFLTGGKDCLEKLRLIDAALEYRKQELVRTESVLKEAKHKENTAAVESGFTLDTSAGALVHARFSEEAIFERVLQKHSDKLIRVGSKTLVAFDKNNCMWKVQDHSCFGLLRDFVIQEIYTMFEEPAFIAAKGTENGELKLSKLEAAKAKYQTANYVRSICVNIMIPSDKYKKVRNFSSFEPNPHLFYCANGVLDLRTGELRPPKPSDLLMHQSEVVYSSTATCPKWLKNLHEVQADDESTEYTPETEDRIRGIRSAWSYSLGTSTTERYIFLYKGGGKNGKSCLFFALEKLLGSYCGTIGHKKLALDKASGGDSAERLGYSIQGKRVAIVRDLTVGGKWDDGLIKCLTEDTILIRGLYQEIDEVPNVTKIHISLNGKCPTPQGDDVALVRRLYFIPFPREFKLNPLKEQQLKEDIIEELSGILTWLQQDYQARYEAKQNVYKPEAGNEEWEEYQKEAYPINKVIQDMFEKAPMKMDKYLVPNTVLADEIIAYCNSESYRSLNAKPVDFEITYKTVANAFSRLMFDGKMEHMQDKKRAKNKHWYVKRKLV